jgi:hypothetical protein
MKNRQRSTLICNEAVCIWCGHPLRNGCGCGRTRPRAPTVNHRDPELLLDMPAINYAEIVEEQRTGRPPKARPAPVAKYIGDCLPDPPAVFAFNEKAEGSNADAVGGGSVQMGDAEDDEENEEREAETRRRLGGEKRRSDDDDLLDEPSIDYAEIVREQRRTR